MTVELAMIPTQAITLEMIISTDGQEVFDPSEELSAQLSLLLVILLLNILVSLEHVEFCII